MGEEGLVVEATGEADEDDDEEEASFRHLFSVLACILQKSARLACGCRSWAKRICGIVQQYVRVVR